MTITELQKKLQEMYERYGDVEVRHQYGELLSEYIDYGTIL